MGLIDYGLVGSSTKLLTSDQELDLIRRRDDPKTTPAERRTVIGELMSHNLRLAYRRAWQWRRKYPTRQAELESAALWALFKAARMFRGGGARFSTYAMKVIDREVGRAAEQEFRLISVGTNVVRAVRGERKCQPRNLFLGRQALDIRSSWDFGVPSLELLAIDHRNDEDEDAEDRNQLWLEVQMLPPRLQDIIRRRYTGKSQTQREIAEEFGITKTRVGQLENQAIVMIKKRIWAKMRNRESKAG